MSIDFLFTDFDRLIQSSESVHRLRRFILDLAVRGKLVPQDPNDEPALELLKRIEQTRDERHKRKLALIEIDPTKTDFDLPDNWNLAPLGVLGGWAIGTGFPKSEQGRTEGPYFFLKVSDMNLPGNEKVIVTAQNRIDDEVAARIRAKVHSVRTIIFPKIGGAIATNKRRILSRPSAIDNNCLGITISSEINLNWAYLLLTSLDFTRYQAGTAVPALQQGVLERISVAIPPFPEQRRIVAKVDELMAFCDRLEATRAEREATRDRLTAASLARLNAPGPNPAMFQHDVAFALNNLTPLTTRPDQIKTLRQTILNLAVRGKLVEQDSTEGTGQDLLFELGKARNTWETVRRVRKQKDKNSVVEDEKYLDLPTSWAWARLVNLGQTQTGTSPSSANPELFGDFVPFVKPADLDGNEVNYSGPGLSEKGIAHSRLAPEHSVLMVCIGATLGKVNKTTRSVCFNQQINCLTPFIEGITDFVAFALKASGFQELAWSKAGTGTLPIISKSKWEVLPVPLPPLAEQHRIVARVDELMALFDQLEASLTTGGETQGRLVEAVLHKLLSGDKINPSWPGVGICRNRGEND